MANCYNVAVIGKTGVGKSSLINYLFGSPIHQTGVGHPITKPGFHPLEFRINNLPVRVYDSWGLEVGSYREWILSLRKEMAKRTIDEDIDQWFHSVFYCLSVGDHRVLDIDLNIIREILDYDCQVTVVFTKADLATAEELESLKEILDTEFNNQVPVIPVCSHKGLYGKNKVKPFGYIELAKQTSRDFWMTMAKRLPKRCMKMIDNIIENWARVQRAAIREEVGVFGRYSENLALRLTNDLHEFIFDLKDHRIRTTITIEFTRARSLYTSFAKILHLEEVDTALGHLDLTEVQWLSVSGLEFSEKLKEEILNIIIPGRVLFKRKILAKKLISRFDSQVVELKKHVHPLGKILEDRMRESVGNELHNPVWHWQLKDFFSRLLKRVKIG